MCSAVLAGGIDALPQDGNRAGRYRRCVGVGVFVAAVVGGSMPATRCHAARNFQITTDADSAPQDPPITGSLRWAIEQANLNPGLDTIAFALDSERLRLNAFGRSLLDKNGSLSVCVRVKVTAGRKLVDIKRQLVTLRK